jgi:glycosyltransferase involved in cell wall biosynthesis
VLGAVVLTRGSPGGLSGGHLYQRRMADAATAHGVAMRFAPASLWRRPPRADVLVIDSIAAWRLAPWVLARRPPRWVAAVHQRPGGVDGGRLGRRLHRRIDAFVYRRCDVVVAVSRPLADDLVRHAGVSRRRVRVVEPGCDLRPSPSSPPRGPGGPVVFLSVANWLPNKGVLELLAAFERLPAGALSLHLVGRNDVDARYARRIRMKLDRPGLRDRVVVHGAVDHAGIADLYASADAFVTTSAAESYGTACAEALAMGLPVVGWRLPHMDQLVTDGVEGCLVEPHDIDALAGALERLARDSEWRRQLADGARHRGSTLPTWDDTARRFFAALGDSRTAAVEPADDRAVGRDVDAGDAGVLHEHAPHDVLADVERPRQRRLDGADVRDDDHDG